MSIILEHVSKIFDERVVINDFCFQFENQGKYCIVGPSGCGKTTLLRMIAGLIMPDRGIIHGVENTAFGMHFQQNRLIPWINIKKNLKLVMPENNISEWLNKAGLSGIEEKYPNELSGGMKRRVSLIRALACESSVLLLDEPLRELDEHTMNVMTQMILKNADSKMVIMVTHDHSLPVRLGCQVIDLTQNGLST